MARGAWIQVGGPGAGPGLWRHWQRRRRGYRRTCLSLSERGVQVRDLPPQLIALIPAVHQRVCERLDAFFGSLQPFSQLALLLPLPPPLRSCRLASASSEAV